MIKTLLILLILWLQIDLSYSQNNKSIYEFGDSITSCEINFKNLFNNWTLNNITNAEEYQLLEYNFVETITDSVRYKYYRNYFSGNKTVYGSLSSRSGKSSNGLIIPKLFIKPGFIHNEIYDTTGLPEKAKMILTDDIKKKAKDLLEQDMDIDTMSLNIYIFKSEKIDTIIRKIRGFRSYGIRKKYTNQMIAYPEYISDNFINIYLKKNKSYEELNINDLQKITLEQLLIEKIQSQLFFNEKVAIGDKVYTVSFMYNNKLYSMNVICNTENKKVVMDYFFQRILIK